LPLLIIMIGRSVNVESRIKTKGGFGLTPGKLVTLSKPDPYPKYVQRLRKIPNL